MTERTVILNEPHINQQKVLNEKKRFNVVCCGRRWGKSALAVNILCEAALKGEPAGYFTPTYKLLDGTYQDCMKALNDVVQRKNEHQFINIVTGGNIDFWSLENDMAGRSRKYKVVIVDEGAFDRNLWEHWTESIRPTLTDLKGDAYFLSTPKGKNDFFKLFQRGKHEANWMSWRMPTVSNPYIDPEEIEDARHDLPALAFSQEYLAEFNDNIANPFGTEYIASCVKPLSNKAAVCFGVDLAKSFDYTVIIGLDEDCNVCHFDRFQMDWKSTTERIKNLPSGVPLAVDSTGVGDPIGEELARGRYVDLIKFTPQSKQQMMEGLAVKIQKGEIGFPDGIIRDELDNFEYIYGRTGVKYGAPTGLHDDCVCSLALAVSRWKQGKVYGKYSII